MKVIAAIFLAVLTFAIHPTLIYAQESTGTVDNIIEGFLKNLDSYLVTPEIQSIVSTENPGSAEKTTIGEMDPNKPPTGAVRSMGKYLANIIVTKPVSSNEYIASLMDNVGLPINTQVYAQTAGLGFDVFQPVLSLWRSFRNIAYLLYVVVFVVIGFMIMLRRKIDPQTVISIQTALPRLVITLLLITFSYAIAGLVIDLMYVAIYVPVFLLSNGTSKVFESPSTVIEILMNHNLFGIITNPGLSMSEAPAQAAIDIVSSLLGYTFNTNGIASRLVKLVISGMMLFAMFQLFIKLGVGFFKIILAVVIAPIQIMLNAVPGSDAFSKWLRGIISNAAMFPAVAFIFVIAAALMGPVSFNPLLHDSQHLDNPWGVVDGVGYAGRDDPSQDAGWLPPFLLLRGPGSNFISDGSQVAVSGAVNPAIALIGFFAIMIAPQVAEMTRDFFKSEKSPYGSAIGQYAGASLGMMTAPYRKMKAQSDARQQHEAMGAAVARNIQNTASP